MKSAWIGLLCLSSGVLFTPSPVLAAAPVCDVWPAWKFYKAHLLEGGRVVDAESANKITTSEAQSYGLFFALVANDRESFEGLLSWTENNLAQGDFTAHLPAWLWGRRDDNSWGVLDANPASDADLWIAYTLAQAGQLWNERRYRVLSQLIAHRILREETALLPGLGQTLLPAPSGFQTAPDLWRLNPSYVPIQVLRGLERSDEESPWAKLIDSSAKLISDSAPAGFSPDWTLYESGKGFKPDADTRGSYNAIRVYLWAGMLDAQEPHREILLKALKPMAQRVVQLGVPPEVVNTVSGEGKEAGPAGFSAAMVPFLMASGVPQAAREQSQRVDIRPAAATAYYNQSLSLFGLGWRDGYFKFSKDGTLMPRWSKACVRSAKH